jgi:dolichol-phosphate mannosyltransferase
MPVLIVAPTYNERDNIELFLRGVRAAVPDATVLIVDDNSPDGTGHLADELASQLGMVKVLHREAKSGLGSAYRHALQAALDERYDIVVTMDVDLSHDPAAIPDLIGDLNKGYDVALGSRYVEGGSVYDWPLHRRLLSRWGNRYTALVLGVPVSDCTTGFRAYSSSALRVIEPQSTTAEGYAFLTELIRRMVRSDLAVVETPICFRDRRAGTSKMSVRIIIETMVLVTRWAFSDRWSDRTLRSQRSRPRTPVSPTGVALSRRRRAARRSPWSR